MDPRRLNEFLPGTNLEFSRSLENLSRDEVAYLYNLTGDEDFSDDHFARAKDMSVDALMTNFVQVYKYEDQVMAHNIVAPPKSVRSRTGPYKKRGREILDISVSDTGSDKGETNEILMKVGEGTYTIEIRKLKIFVSDDEIKEVGPLNAIQEAVVLLKHGIDLRQEIRIRNLAEATTNTAAAAAVWDTGATVNTDIVAAKNAFALANGQEATHVQFNKDVANEMLANTAQGAGVFGTIPSPLSARAVVGELDAMKFFQGNKPWGLVPVVTNVMYSTAVGPEDAQVAAYVWPDNAYLFRVDNATRSTTWGMQPELMPVTIVRWRDEDRGGWLIKIVRKRDEIEATSTAIREITTVT